MPGNPGSTDVVVVGGGVVGCAAAYYLAGEGLSVTIVERDSVASHASGFAYGGLTPVMGIYIDDPLVALSAYADELHAELAESLPELTGVDTEYRAKPSLMLATRADEVPAIRELYEWLTEHHGGNIGWLEQRELRETEARLSPDIPAGMFTDISHEVEPYKFTLALAQAAESRGAEFRNAQVTGLKLNGQELRNAEYFGPFKTLMYELAYEQFERWRRWRVVTDDEISRMLEVEITSDLALSFIDGLTGKTQKRIGSLYGRFDEKFSGSSEFSRRFRKTMDAIDDLLGDEVPATIWKDQVHFYTLSIYLYDRLYGLGSKLERKTPKRLPRTLRPKLLEAARRFREQDVPLKVLDAVLRASADTGRRQTRLDFVKSVCDGRTE
ncbi:MAG: FAD-binding oxidoreductase [Chloroflexi bacterium]|nr:FAD-binding oxidoreductase [Chloroflexota bacterium]